MHLALANPPLPPQASEMYDRVLAMEPSHWRACLNKGVVQYAEGAKTEAKELLNSAFVMSGHHPEVFHEIKVGAGRGPAGRGAV